MSTTAVRRFLFLLLAAPIALAQQPEPPAVAPQPAGQVIVSSEHPPQAAAAESSSLGTVPDGPGDSLPKMPVTQQERAAVVLSSLALDLHLTPADAAFEGHASLIARNVSTQPLSRIVLQLSSTLRWQQVAVATPAGLQAATFTQSPIATDEDHTGYAQEAAIQLAQPLAPGATVALSVFYVGRIAVSAARLELLGTPATQAEHADWDAIEPTTDTGATGLRGFGNVLWYPVAEPTAVLGDGNQLFQVVDRQRLHESAAGMSLRLTVEYQGDPPNAAIFNGLLQPLAIVPDDRDTTVEQAHGIATASFAASSAGLSTASLFLTGQAATTTPDGLLTVVTPRSEAVAPYAQAAAAVGSLLSGWFGPVPAAPMLLLDHAGQPFEQGALLVQPLATVAKPEELAPLLVGALCRAWYPSTRPWIAEGLAQWMRIAWTERSEGKPAAREALAAAAHTIAFAEPDLVDPAATGQPLIAAATPVFYRFKAASVWWQLRELVGEDSLRKALLAYRHAAAANPHFEDDPKAMQQMLERASGSPLDWFFDDWVYRDRGLPDLTVVSVNPRPLPSRPDRNSGYLVAVEVRNDGDAVADVPVTVRAGTTFVSVERLRILPHASASTRVLFEGTPETVEVNDGSVPEQHSSSHLQTITVRP